MVQIAGLFPGLRTSLLDRRSKRARVKSFEFKNGLEGYLLYLTGKRELLHPPIRIIEKVNAYSNWRGQARHVDVGMDICFSLTPPTEKSVFGCFTNASENHLGGSHKEGLCVGVLQALSEVGALERFGFSGKVRFDSKNLRRGIVAVISIIHPMPSYGGCTRHELDSPEVRHAVYNCVRRDYLAFLLAHPEVLKSIKAGRHS